MTALARLSELEKCSPSELLKIMLIEHLNALEEKGIETGLVAK